MSIKNKIVHNIQHIHFKLDKKYNAYHSAEAIHESVVSPNIYHEYTGIDCALKIILYLFLLTSTLKKIM